jgi:RHS repeat-associated protein
MFQEIFANQHSRHNYGEIAKISDWQPVRMPFPGRRARRAIVVCLASAIVLITILSSISTVLPGIISFMFPIPNNQPSVQPDFTGTPTIRPRIPLLPGTVTSGRRETPFYSTAADTSIPPILMRLSDRFLYETSFGQYSFNRSYPYVFTLVSRSGVPLTKGSWFFVNSSSTQLLAPGRAVVMASTNAHFDVSYGVLFGNVTVGTMNLQADFYQNSKPKLSASFTEGSAWNLGSFNIVWSTVSNPKWFRAAGSTIAAGDSGLESITDLPHRASLSSPSIEAGSFSERSAWTDSLTIDWSDAPQGVLQVGPAKVDQISGTGFTVAFPQNQGTIDPTQAGTSSDSHATGYSTQRKTFNYGGYYFVFYYDGNNIVYSTSLNGLTWTSGYTGSGQLNYGFDVYNSGSMVVMAWLDYSSSVIGDGVSTLHFQRGWILGGSITLDPVRNVAIIPQHTAWPPTVAIGSDGMFWVGGVWPDSTGSNYLWIYNSSDSIQFTLSTQYATSATTRYEAFELVPLPRGRLMALSSYYSDTTIRWKVLNPLGPSGPSWGPVQSFNAFLPSNTYKWNLISAVGSPDGFVHLLTSPGTTYWSYNDTSGSWSAPMQISFSASDVYPSVSVDSLGGLHVVWASFGALWYVFRPKSQVNWLGGTGIFGAANSIWFTVPRTSSTHLTVVWTQTPSPYAIEVGVVPLVSGMASTPPYQSWSKLGVTSTLSSAEYVAPGNGLLSVGYTDMSAPGRGGLDLSIRRLNLPPFVMFNGGPFNYENSPYSDLGNGWQLNLPWVGQQYLHSADGQIFPLAWTNYNTTTTTSDIVKTWSFGNDGSVGFVFQKINDTNTSTWVTTTSYKMIGKDGSTYSLNSAGLVTSLVDRTGQNQITFTQGNYAPYYTLHNTLTTITDSVGRVATFSYSPDQFGRLASVTYAGQTVNYAYSGSNLVTATDQLQHTITYGYDPSTHWLITRITYPTGGYTNYTYGCNNCIIDPQGTSNYYVTLQNVYANTLTRSTSFSYQITDGSVTFTNVTQSDGLSVQGSTSYEFNAKASSMTVTSFDGSGVQMKKVRYWNDANGRVIQQDVYSGNTASRSFYTQNGYDQWGNQVYSRDPLGHESYGSFANTDSQYKFQGPGNLTTTADGRIFYDDFNVPQTFNAGIGYTNWYISPTLGAVSTSATTSSSLLTLQGASTTQGSWQGNWMRARQTFNYPFYAEVQMSLNSNPGSSTIDADFELSPQGLLSGNPWQNSDQLRFILNDGPIYYVEKCVGGSCGAVYGSGVVAGGSLSVSWKIVLLDANTLTVYLNSGSGYKRIVSTTSLGLSSSFTPSFAYLAFYNSNTAIYSGSFDYVGLYGSNSIIVNGLQQGQRLELYDSNNVLQSSASVASGQSSVTLNGTSMVFPYGYLKIYEQDGRSLQSISPTREVWGGTTYAYTKPFRSGGLTRTSTGFLTSTTTYVDDSLPSGAQLGSDGGDSWLWAGQPYAPVVSGLYSSVGFSQTGEHQHFFWASTTTLSPSSGSFLIQYVYIPSYSVPSEIMIQFHDTSGSWEHRAYWGSNLINWGTDGTASRLNMGPLPATRDSWIELIVKADDVAANGLAIDGMGYALYNGGAYWDFSALGDSSTGSVTITNLRQTESVNVYDSTMNQVTSSSVVLYATSLTLNLYSAGVNVFPFSGYFKVYTETNSLEYSSPLISNVWGRDVYTYNQPTDHYPTLMHAFYFDAVNSKIHNAMVGNVGYLNSTSATESYSQYSSVGNLLQAKQRYDSSSGLQWITRSTTYDSYGNALTSTDPVGNKAYYTYSPAYQNAYITNQTRRDGTTQLTILTGYNFTNGMNLWRVDARGYNTTFQYDVLGRLKTITYPSNLGSITYSYVDAGNYVDITNPNGWKTRQIYDQLGRQSIVETFLGIVPYSNRTTSYNWQNLIASQIDQIGNRTSYQYDYLGRLTVTTKPDGNSTHVYYNDILSQVRAMDEYGKNRCSSSDQLGRLVSVIEITNSTCSATALNGYYYVTNYSYDWVGNLRVLTNAAAQATKYSYDTLNRLTGTVYPDGTSESFAYDNNGNVIRKTDRAGVKTLAAYDAFNRIKTTTFCGATIKSTSYTYDGNNNILTIQNENSTITYTYDARNRVLNERYQINPSTRTITDLGCSGSGSSWTVQGGISEDYTVTHTYAGDVLSTITYPTVGSPTNIGVGYVYDSLGRVLVANQTGSRTVYFAQFSYLKTGEIKGIQFGNGLIGNYTYDNLQRATSIVLKNGSTALLSLSYNYNKTGTVASVTGQVNSATVNEQYSYDSLMRLTNATVTSQGSTDSVSYQYDNLGNRLTQTNNTVVTNYSYTIANNELRSLSIPSTGASTAYSYDFAGRLKTMNVTSGTTNRWAYTWNVPGQLLNVTKNGIQQSRYAYDGQARQVESVEPGSSTTFYSYYGSETLYKQFYGSYSIDFVYAQGLRIAKVDSSGGHSFNNIQYFHSDALGSIRLITSGTSVYFADGYQPYGSDNGAPFGSSAEKYTGKTVSATTGLYYNFHRWYDQATGRFISPDLRPGKLTNPQTTNRYLYVVDLPTSKTDPSGEGDSYHDRSYTSGTSAAPVICDLSNPFTYGACANAGIQTFNKVIVQPTVNLVNKYVVQPIVNNVVTPIITKLVNPIVKNVVIPIVKNVVPPLATGPISLTQGGPNSLSQNSDSGGGLPHDVGPQSGLNALFAPFANALLAIAHSTDFLPPCWQIVAGVGLAVGFSVALAASDGGAAAIGTIGVAGVYTVSALWVVEGLIRAQDSSACWG